MIQAGESGDESALQKLSYAAKDVPELRWTVERTKRGVVGVYRDGQHDTAMLQML